MSLPIFSADNDFAIWAVLMALASFGFWCERFEWGRKYTGVMLMITLAIILANLRVIPTAAPAYDAVWEYLVPVAIPLLLFKADLSRIISESGSILIAFAIGSAAVVAGSLVAASLLDLGRAEPEMAGIFTGTYIGGGLNFAAVADATGMRNSSNLAAAVAADNIVTNLHFLLIVLIPGISWVQRRFPSTQERHSLESNTGSEQPPHTIENLDIAGLLAGLALAFLLASIGKSIAGLIGKPQFSILVITALALIVATGAPNLVRRLSGHGEAGFALMFIFLASIGASADIWQLIGIAPIFFGFASIIVVVHLIILFSVGGLLRLDLAEMLVASAVCIGGPATAAALTSTKGWGDLMIPGVLAGSLGYAIGSFVGVSVSSWLS